MKNVFPASTAMTSADFLCFILFLLISIPLLHIPPEKFRIPFLVTAVTSTITSFALFFWALGKAHGGGPLLTSSATEVTGVQQVHGSALAWAVFYGISSQMGQICAGVRWIPFFSCNSYPFADPQHVRLHSFCSQTRRSSSFPSGRCASHGGPHLFDRNHLYLVRCKILPRRRSPLGALRPAHFDPNEWWSWGSSGCVLRLYVGTPISLSMLS